MAERGTREGIESTAWLAVGARTVDEDGHTGTIYEIEDMHNIHTKLDNGGGASYCMVKDCEDYFPCLPANRENTRKF